HDHERTVEGGHGEAAGVKRLGGDGQVAERIVAKGIDSERDHDDVRVEVVDGVEAAVQLGEKRVVVPAPGQRPVHSGAQSETGAAFVGVAGEVRIGAVGIAVE